MAQAAKRQEGQEEVRGQKTGVRVGERKTMEPGGKESRKSGFCSCGCGKKLNGSGRGSPQRWATDACRKRAEMARRRRISRGRQMIDLGAMSIPQRQQALLEAARAAMRTDHRLAGWA